MRRRDAYGCRTSVMKDIHQHTTVFIKTLVCAFSEMCLCLCVNAAGGTIGGKDDGVLTTSVIGCGRPGDSKGVDLRIVDTEVNCG